MDDIEQPRTRPRQSTYFNGFLVDDDAEVDGDANAKADDEEAAPSVGNGVEIKMGCGIMGRYPIISLLSFVITGMVLGIGLSFWVPTTEEELVSKQVALQWIGLIGDMFLRYVYIALWLLLLLLLLRIRGISITVITIIAF